MCCKSKAQKRLSDEDQEKCLKEFLKSDDFPSRFNYIILVYGLIVAAVIIIFQILSIIYKSPFYYVGSGIWGGLVLLLSKLVEHRFLKYRTLMLYKLSKLTGLIANLITIPTMVLANVAYKITDKASLEYSVLWINWTMFGVLVVLKISTLVLKVVTIVKTNQAYKAYGKNVENEEHLQMYSTEVTKEKSLSEEEKKECQEKFLKSSEFPILCYQILRAYAFCCGLIIIIFQILSIVYKSPFYYVGSGIWGGLAQVIAVFTAIPFVNYRTVKYFKLMKLFGIAANILTFPTMILANIAFQRTDRSSTEWSYIWINATMLGVLIPYKIIALITTILTIVRQKKFIKSYATENSNNV